MNGQNINLNLDLAKDIECEKCGSNRFTTGFFLKRLSSLQSPTGKEIVIPLQTFACIKCEHVNEELMKHGS